MHLNDPMLVGEHGRTSLPAMRADHQETGTGTWRHAPFIVDDADLDAAVEAAPIFPEVGAADKTVAFQ